MKAVQLWSYLNRAVRRFHRASMRKPGKVRAQGARLARSDAERVRSAALPSGRSWLVREFGWEAAVYLGYLDLLLGEIATRAALSDTPGAGRVLRSICRMLGVTAAVPPLKLVATATSPEPLRRVGAGVAPTDSPGVVGDCEVAATGG